MGCLRHFKRFCRVLQSLLGVLMSSDMVALSMMLHGRAVRVCGHIVKFGGFLMRFVHRALPRPYDTRRNRLKRADG